MSLIAFVVYTVWAKDVEIKFQESTAAINQRQLQLRGRDAERKRGFQEGERETQVCNYLFVQLMLCVVYGGLMMIDV